MSDLLAEVFSDLEDRLCRAENERDYIKKLRDDPRRGAGGECYHWMLTRLPSIEREVARVRLIIDALRLYKYLVPGASPEQLNALFVSADGLRMLGWVDTGSSAREVVRPIMPKWRVFDNQTMDEVSVPFHCRKYRFDGEYQKSPFGRLAIFKEVES
jgi:hypothetical protein